MKKLSPKITKIIYATVALTFFVISLFLIFDFYRTIMNVYNPQDSFQVKETANLKYSVCIKEDAREFYGEPCLDMDGSYVYNHVDFIRVVNAYKGLLSEDLETDYTYKAIATLVVKEGRSGSTNNSVLWDDRTYELDSKIDTFRNSTIINTSFDLNLDEYKEEAIKYGESLPFNVSAELRVDFIVELKGSKTEFSSKYVRSMTIPLSSDSFKITLSDNTEQISDYKVTDQNLFTIGFFVKSISIIICYVIIFLAIKTLLAGSSLYRRTINKYLKTYDDVIINTDSPMDFDNYEMLTINAFKELLDLSYSANTPIMFYETKQGGLFYVYYNDIIYLHIVNKN